PNLFISQLVIPRPNDTLLVYDRLRQRIGRSRGALPEFGIQLQSQGAEWQLASAQNPNTECRAVITTTNHQRVDVSQHSFAFLDIANPKSSLLDPLSSIFINDRRYRVTESRGTIRLESDDSNERTYYFVPDPQNSELSYLV